MRNKKSVLMTLNHNYGYFSGVGSGIAGNLHIGDTSFANLTHGCEIDEVLLLRVAVYKSSNGCKYPVF